MPATTVAGWAHANQANRGQRSAITCHARPHSGWLCPRRSSEQRPAQRPQLSSPPTPVAGSDFAGRHNRGPNSVLKCRALHHSRWLSQSRTIEQRPKQRPHLSCRHHRGWLCPRRPNEQRSEQCPHLSCQQTQRLAQPTPTDGAEARPRSTWAEPATVVAGTTGSLHWHLFARLAWAQPETVVTATTGEAA